MRNWPTPPPSKSGYIPMFIAPGLVRDAQLYSCGRTGADAVEYVLADYGHLIGELRRLRRRCAQLDEEGRALDERLSVVQAACRVILEL